jgi:hypothetical protein
MPYPSIPKEKETKQVIAWMERCIKRVMADGKDKSSAIAICTSVLKKNNYDVSSASEMFDALILNPEGYKRLGVNVGGTNDSS